MEWSGRVSQSFNKRERDRAGFAFNLSVIDTWVAGQSCETSPLASDDGDGDRLIDRREREEY